MVKQTRIVVVGLALLLCSLAVAGQKDKNAPQTRTLLGTVTNKADKPLENALVYLKNNRTLTVQTFITGPDGKFRFNSLSPNTDYDVFAELNGKRSNTRTLSSFDTRAEAFMPLKINSE